MSNLKDQLNKIIERVNELENNPSELTKDALLAEVRTFYDVAKNVSEKAAKKPQKAAPVVKEVPIPKVVEAVKQPEPAVEKVMEPVIEKVAEPVAEVKPVVETPKADEKPKAKKEPLIGKDEADTKASDKKILAGQFNKEPLSDLRSGIPLNEKFGIIRNLFKGNASDFGDAVLKLNNAANSEEMAHYLELLSQRFEWDLNSEAYTNFSGYVNRKMMTLEPSKSDAN